MGATKKPKDNTLGADVFLWSQVYLKIGGNDFWNKTNMTMLRSRRKSPHEFVGSVVKFQSHSVLVGLIQETLPGALEGRWDLFQPQNPLVWIQGHKGFLSVPRGGGGCLAGRRRSDGAKATGHLQYRERPVLALRRLTLHSEWRRRGE